MTLLNRRAFLGSSLAGAVACISADYANKNAPKGGIGANGQVPIKGYLPTTLHLTWQRDPTTTMTVQWVDAAGATPETTIYYTQAMGLNWFNDWHACPAIERPFPKTNLKLFRAELTGLKPDTNYDFRIGHASPTYRFRTMPAKANDTISFISGGDSGVNQHAVNNNINAARQDPMFAVIGGDLAYENGRNADTFLAFLRNYSKHMIGRNGRLIPMIAILGNHEVDGGYDQPRAKAPFFFALFDGLYPETSYNVLDFGDYLSLVLLDTGHINSIDGEQTDWLRQTLNDRADHPHVMVVNHVPAYPSYRSMGNGFISGTGADNREFWVPLFEKYRVPVVLEHHDHTFKRSKPLLGGLAHGNGVLYLGDGSWGMLRPPRPAEKLPHMAALSKDYHLSLHRLQGQERFHLALDEFGRVMDVCRSGQRRQGLMATAG
jgi:Purple acid Phosphatase, N-terminal domain/Calcineurin-like phosphoesterase